LLLIAIFLADRFGIRETFGWHIFYISNLYFFNKGEFGGPLSHLWTLSVEEQFYLFWPWLVLFAPKKTLPFVICLLIVFAPMTRVLLYTTGHHDFAQYNTLVFSNFDRLGCGALLAWAHTSAQRHQRNVVVRAIWIGTPISLMIMGLSIVVGEPIISVASDQLALAVTVTGILQATQTRVGRNILGFLSISPIVYLGQISYGIYLYHMFAPNILGKVINLLGEPEILKQQPAGVFVMMLITLFVASVSWFVVERPINSLKSRFPYFRTRTVRPAFPG
jgi:peptidoglycan/LPS O-acetylase OafA/YrhL